MPSNDVSMMIKHQEVDMVPLSPSPLAPGGASAPSSTATPFPLTSKLGYEDLAFLLANRSASEMRHLRNLLRQHLTCQERVVEWSKFVLNIVVAVVAVIVGIQTLQSRIDTLTTSVNGLSTSVTVAQNTLNSLTPSITMLQSQTSTLSPQLTLLNSSVQLMYGQLGVVQQLSNDLKTNITKLNLQPLYDEIVWLNQTATNITYNTQQTQQQLNAAQTQLQQQNTSTFTQLDQLWSSAQTNLSSYVAQASLMVNTALSSQNEYMRAQLSRVSNTSYLQVGGQPTYSFPYSHQWNNEPFRFGSPTGMKMGTSSITYSNATGWFTLSGPGVFELSASILMVCDPSPCQDLAFWWTMVGGSSLGIGSNIGYTNVITTITGLVTVSANQTLNIQVNVNSWRGLTSKLTDPGPYVTYASIAQIS